MTPWPTVRLDQCATIVSGATPSTNKSEYWDGDIHWATPKDLSDLKTTGLNDTARKITITGLASCAATVLPPGSVLFSSRAPIGLVAINKVPMATNQGFKSFVPDPKRLMPEYLFYWLKYNRARIEQIGNGATFKEVSKEAISRVEIPLPPLWQQRRIASTLDAADALRAKRTASIVKLQSLADSLFFEMFVPPARRTKLLTVKVNDMVSGFETGRNVVADDQEDPNSKYRVLKISAVTSFEFRPSENKAVPPDHTPEPEHFVKRGDLLFSRANTTELVGATAYVSDPPPDNLLLPDKLWRFVWREPRRVNPIWAWHLFRSPAMRYELGRRATGTSGSMKNISQEKLLQIEVSLPSLDLQNHFARRAEATTNCLRSARLSEAKLDALFASLQRQALSGQLSPDLAPAAHV